MTTRLERQGYNKAQIKKFEIFKERFPIIETDIKRIKKYIKTKDIFQVYIFMYGLQNRINDTIKVGEKEAKKILEELNHEYAMSKVKEFRRTRR